MSEETVDGSVAGSNSSGDIDEKNDMSGQVDSVGDDSSPESDEVIAELRILRAQADEERDKYLRLMAEFDNFKKRSLKERADLQKYQGEPVLTDLLDVLDNLELAIGYSSADHEKLVSGLQMIQKMFIEKLEKWGVKGESNIGKDFDPVKHAAISKVLSADTKPGTIVGELKKTYFYKDKLIRVGEVVVAAEEQA